MKGLFRITRDPQFAAAHITDDSVILFPGQDGRAHRDRPQNGSLEQLSENALLVQVHDVTLMEAATAHLENRVPRWLSVRS